MFSHVCILFKYLKTSVPVGEFIYYSLPLWLMVDQYAKETKASSQITFMLYVLQSLVKFEEAGVYFFFPFAI